MDLWEKFGMSEGIAELWQELGISAGTAIEFIENAADWRAVYGKKYKMQTE
jgi:hypothetical protein